jgi:hypothetical protein
LGRKRAEPRFDGIETAVWIVDLTRFLDANPATPRSVRRRLSLENLCWKVKGRPRARVQHKAASMNDQADTLIRINRQWRVCFRWTPDGSEAVEIADYH